MPRERRDYRSSFDIVADILNASRTGINRTEMMRRCNLSYKQLKSYLGLVVRTRLVAIESDGSQLLFRISDRGKSFLKSYTGLIILTGSKSNPHIGHQGQWSASGKNFSSIK